MKFEIISVDPDKKLKNIFFLHAGYTICSQVLPISGNSSTIGGGRGEVGEYARTYITLEKDGSATIRCRRGIASPGLDDVGVVVKVLVTTMAITIDDGG